VNKGTHREMKAGDGLPDKKPRVSSCAVCGEELLV
jgi:hypothetical protein